MTRELLSIPGMKPPQLLWKPVVLCVGTITVKTCLLLFRPNLLCYSLCHCLLACHWEPLKRAWLYLLYILPPEFFTHWRALHWTFSRLNNVLVLSGSLHAAGASDPWLSLWPFVGFSPAWPCLSCIEKSRTGIQCWVDGKDHLPQTSGNSSSSSSPGYPSFCRLCYSSILLTHGVYQPLRGSILPCCFPAAQPPVCTGIWGYSSPGVLLFAELNENPISPFLPPAEAFLNGNMTLWCNSHSSQFCVIIKFVKGTFCPIIQIN